MLANQDRAAQMPVSSLCVVIPAFNEAATIADLVRRCFRSAAVSRVLVVDDGSTDGTAAIAAAAGAEVLEHERNLGKGAGLRDGMLAVLAGGADSVVTLDGDGQHRPEDVPRLLRCAARWPGHIVIGSRRASSRDAPRVRAIANRVADFWVSWAAGHPIDDSQSGFRVYPREVLGAIADRGEMARGFAFETEVLIEAARLGVRTVSVAIPTIYGDVLRRPSHFRPVADVTRIVLLVGGRLLRMWMYPAGLWRSLTLAPSRCAE